MYIIYYSIQYSTSILFNNRKYVPYLEILPSEATIQIVPKGTSGGGRFQLPLWNTSKLKILPTPEPSIPFSIWILMRKSIPKKIPFLSRLTGRSVHSRNCTVSKRKKPVSQADSYRLSVQPMNRRADRSSFRSTESKPVKTPSQSTVSTCTRLFCRKSDAA
jgi:hypothetical protein